MIFLSLIILFCSNIRLSFGLPYNADCNPSNDTCDRSTFLGCHQTLNKCRCLPPGESTYDQDLETCRLLSGAGCVPLGGQLCIRDSQCLPSPGSDPYRCQCSNNFGPNKNRECFQKYDTPCDIFQSYCDPAGFLVCNPNLNKCRCPEPNHWYDEVNEECRVLLGQSCDISREGPRCGDNAYCNQIRGICECHPTFEPGNWLPGNRNCYLAYNTTCSAQNDQCNKDNFLTCSSINSKCECQPGFFESNYPSDLYTVTCLPGYQQICPYGQNRLPCSWDAALSCSNNGICQCSRPNFEVYVPERRSCNVKVGFSCLDEVGMRTKSCIPHASCGETDNLCTCDFGFRASDFGYCSSGFTFSANLAQIVALFITISVTGFYNDS